MLYFERKMRFPAIQWDGSNTSDVEDFVALLPKLDPWYAQFTDVSVSAMSGLLTVSWSGGSTQFSADDFVTGGLVSGTGVGLVAIVNTSNLPVFNTIEP